MKTPDLVVLDLDGTLVRLGVSWDRVRAEIGRELSERGLRPAGGVLATLGYLDGLGETAAARACRAIVADAELQAAERAPVNRALLRWLELVVTGARLGVLTLNDRAAALRAVGRLPLGARLDPDDVLGRDEAAPKPNPEGLQRLLSRHRLAPWQALLVGDSDTDHACGRAAGVATLDVREIGLSWRHGELRQAAAVGADHPGRIVP